MCDVNKTRFFRPWNGADGLASAETVAPEDETMTGTTTTTGSPLERKTIGRTIVKREDSSVEEDEDSESVASSASGATSGTGSYRRRGGVDENKIGRRQSVSSSCSTNSCEDIAEAGSLDRLSNFVFGAVPEVDDARSRTESSAAIRSSSSSSEVSSCASRGSPRSAFTPTSYQCPVYSALDYLTPLRVGLAGSSENGTSAAAAAAAAASFEAAYTAHHPHQHLFYGLTGMPIGPYSGSVEEAVNYIHQQDAAAKQMKKLRPKKFRCEHCDVAFSNNGQLKGHVRIHTGERPFKCDAEGCGKSFTRNEELTRHKRIHTGLRPHSCLLCGKRFGRKDHLKKHTRTHDNRTAYHIPATALGPFAIGHHPLPPGHPMSSYIYPI